MGHWKGENDNNNDNGDSGNDDESRNIGKNIESGDDVHCDKNKESGNNVHCDNNNEQGSDDDSGLSTAATAKDAARNFISAPYASSDHPFYEGQEGHEEKGRYNGREEIQEMKRSELNNP